MAGRAATEPFVAGYYAHKEARPPHPGSFTECPNPVCRANFAAADEAFRQALIASRRNHDSATLRARLRAP